ncbi:MAG TPA: hypothetical protein VN893_04735, partial [Bryobacteraceae bacterium]|nr:hypothetical protein [Bryobacteraceae bacterium]
MRMRNAVITAALSGPLLLLAGDSWRDKDPAQWSSDEVNQVLTNSPWARQVTTSASQEGDRSQSGGSGGGSGRSGGWG